MLMCDRNQHTIVKQLSSNLKKFSSVQSVSRVQLFVASWTAAHQASLPITNSESLLKHMSIESVMPSNHLILCHPLLLPPSILPSIKVFSNESVLHIKVHHAKWWAAATKSLQLCPTLRLHRRQPTRLPRPWDSPGRNTRVVAISFSNA